MHLSMIYSQIFPVTLSIYSMQRAFRDRPFRPTEHRRLVHVDPHPKKVIGALELIVWVEWTPELCRRLTEVIDPCALPRPTLAIVGETSLLPILDKNLNSWYFSRPIWEPEGLLQDICLHSHKIRVVVRYVRVRDSHEMSLRFLYYSDHLLQEGLIELGLIEDKVLCVLSI